MLPSLRHSLLISLCAILCLLPAFILGAGGWDLHTQSLWVKLFSSQFLQGELYPRWLMDMFAGDGSPVFFYYPPFGYFITTFFSFLLPLDPFGYYPIAASVLLATIVAGLAFYIWLLEETGNAQAALLASLLYILAPVNLTQNFYYLLLYSSIWAYAWVPLLMLFAKKLARNDAYAAPGYAVCLCLLVMSNLPMTLMFGSLSVAYYLLHIEKEKCCRQMLRLIGALLLGFGLSALYLLPMLFYIPFANINLEWTRIKLVRRPYIDRLGAVNLIYIMYAGVMAFLMLVYFSSAKSKPGSRFFLGMGLGSLFMLLPFSKPLWDYVPLIGIIQMSERFLNVTALSMAFLAAVALPRWKKTGFGLLAIYACLLVVVAVHTRTTLDKFHKEDPARYNAYTLNIEQYATYLPAPDLFNKFGTPEGLAEVLKHREQVRTIEGDASAEIKEWQPRHILVHYQAKKPSLLLIRQFDFPGWQAFTEGKELDISRNEQTAEIQFAVPAGEGNIQLSLTALIPEIAGRGFSLISAAIIVLLFLFRARARAAAEST